jgi:membrane protein
MASFSLRSTGRLVKQAVSDWSSDNATQLAAALAFYTMLSIAPLLIICMKIATSLFGDEFASSQMDSYLGETIGSKGAEAAQEMLANAKQAGTGVLATIVSVAVLLFSASGVFGQLKVSLNRVWEVPPPEKRGIWGTIKERFFSITLVVGTVFLLIVSLIASTMLTGLTGAIGLEEGVLLEALHFVVSFAVVTLLFGLIFKYLPDARVQWRDVWAGAIATAVLFTIGKFLLGWYLGRATTTSVYGAAGSLVALLLWVYYSAQILFLGAEFTQVWAGAHGRGIEARHAAVHTNGGPAGAVRPQPLV